MNMTFTLSSRRGFMSSSVNRKLSKDINKCILGADKDAECNFNEPGINDKQESIVVRQYFSYVIIS